MISPCGLFASLVVVFYRNNNKDKDKDMEGRGGGQVSAGIGRG